MAKRNYTVTVPPETLARLQAWDNATDAETSWPLGPNRTFRRRGHRTFLVKDYSSMGPGRALVSTLGRAVLSDDGRVDVTVTTKGAWVGWLLVAGGAVCLAVVPRDGLSALGLAALLALSGWGLFLRRPGAQDDLDAVEKVLRRHLGGEWRSGS